MDKLWFDTETYSKLDLRKVGGSVYTRHCEVLLAAYAMNDDPVKVWDATREEIPTELVDGLLEADQIVAHNAQFDRWVARYAMQIDTSIPRWRDTMVKAYTNGLPGKLSKLGKALQLDDDVAKLKEGNKLIQRFCKPAPQNHKADRYTFDNDPVRWRQFIEYARRDVETMRLMDGMMQSWVYPDTHELDLWHLDQAINDHGIYIDIPFVEAAIKTIELEVYTLNCELQEITQGAVEGGTALAKMATWINTRGVRTPDGLNKAAITELLNGTLPPDVRRVLQIRQHLGKSSTAKFQKLIDATNRDNRLRGSIQFYGAARTGRDAGRVFQPQNLPRPTYGLDIEQAVETINIGMVPLLYDDVMDVASSCIRSAITAPPGKILTVADLANIEGRMLAWLAGEEWKLEAYRDYDTIIGTDEKGKPIRKGPDLYKLAYARSFNTSPDLVNSEKRQIGKVQELALGYQGSIGAFNQMAGAYNVHLPDDEVMELVYAWRDAHPAIVKFWRNIESAAIKATESPGITLKVRDIRISVREGKLLIKLPNGRLLMYHDPQVEDVTRYGKTLPKLTYMGENDVGVWCRIATYGGKLVENITQGSARDVLMHGMWLATDSKYQVVLRVHDELVTETAIDDPDFTLEKLCALMAQVPDWAEGLPLAAEGYQAKRYRK